MKNKYFKYSLLIVLIALVGFGVYYFVSNSNEHRTHSHNEEIYTCSMHPQIIKHEPGECPICGMDLIQKVIEDQPVDSNAIAALLQPANGFVVGDFETTTVKDTVIASAISLPGTVTYNPNSSVNVAARISGRIEKMYVHRKFQRVTKGQKLFDLYSPELQTEQQNFIYLIANDAQNATIIKAVKQKLLLYGMSTSQVNALATAKKLNPVVSIYSPANGIVDGTENGDLQNQTSQQNSTTEVLRLKEGDYVTKGAVVFKLVNTDRVWAVFNVIQGYNSLVKINQSIQIESELDANEVVNAKVNFVETQLDPKEKTNRIRVYLDNEKLKYPIGLRLEGSMETNPKKGLWLQKESLVSLGNKKVIFVKKGEGFQATKITTGLEINGFVQVLDGVVVGDRLAQNAQYLIDSGSFIKTK
ncbi:efflux RND transporter periplasmic adaptor subunit [Flavobacterium sp. PL002]|uniref:efflux RND transporter periplasmic adaptor subunit n=1 Tax=Flavobacterium sp. PL002 TaxID=1897058 RepID=UPI0019E83D3A|nr:efflux RND transporter periplasmic adaptor subunit [Flavobacterium sp. PL002]MBE0391707.1 Cation efflux system protein CusB [Flavobacterium sp. PL002]